MPQLAGLFYWWPKMTGKMTNAKGGLWSFILVFAGFQITFFPMHITGLLGMPRRIYTYQDGTGWTAYNLTETIGSYILALGFLLTLFVLVQSLLSGKKAPDDPWGANTLEWASSSPPQEYNFAVIPTVHSLNPLWDGKSLESIAEHAEDPGRTLTEEHRLIQTSELDGRFEKVLTMAEESMMPLIVALLLTAGFVSLLLSAWTAAGVSAVLIGVALSWWLWHRPSVEEAD
jgi:cytochrome c oxidase subunit 1/cytochrome c oxidase subunit I+III